jgi:HlyD family secretion protein
LATRSKWLLLAVLALLAAAAGGALALRRRPAPALTAPSRAAVLNANTDISLSGTVRPQHVTSVGATVEGNIEAFLVDVGEDVFTGQPLARIGAAGLESSREEATAALERAQDAVGKAEAAANSARLETSRADADMQRSRLELDRVQKIFERQNLLHSNGATPRIVYEKAVNDYEAAVKEFEIMDKAARAARDNVQAAMTQVTSAKKTLAEKQEQLQQAEGAFAGAEVRSPVDGMVVGRKGEVGKPAQEAGDQLFQIATDTYALEVALEPEPTVLKRLHPGQNVSVWVLDIQSSPIPAEIKEIKDTQAIVEFNSTTPAIRPGMRADVRVKLD